MYKKIKANKTDLIVNKSYKGERLELKMARIMSSKEPIKDTAPRIYTERKDGVMPDYDVRTDKFEHVIDTIDKASKSHKAKRDELLGKKAKEGMEIEQITNGEPKPTGTTDTK